MQRCSGVSSSPGEPAAPYDCGPFGGVPKRPNGLASKASEGSRPPWVQIPPPPLCEVRLAMTECVAVRQARSTDLVYRA
ncbi:MAG: hypothetical protein QOH48_1136 [Actinomycetota bacterium]|nr:hypothetical protein [Actinomycetota bacterium]